MKITIGFSRPKKFALLSWIIRAVQRTNYSHVYIKFYSNSLDRELIYQASGLQVNFVGGTLFYSQHHDVKSFELDISDADYLKVLQFAVDKAGSPYSIKQLFNIPYYTITGKHLFTLDSSEYVCSELVGEILQKELGLTLDKDLDIVTPKDIYELLTNFSMECTHER